MKTSILSIACAVLTAAAVNAQTTEKSTTTTTTADGASASTTTTTTSSGTITEYTPGSTFIVKETTGPVTYRYGGAVTYVTKKGKVLTDEDVKLRVKVGKPVHVHYTRDGDARVISRVEVDDD